MTAVAKRDPSHVQSYHDADAAMSMARAIWKETGITPTHDVLQSTFATILIHIQNTRKNAPTFPSVPARPQAGQASAAATVRPAPAPATPAPPCPACGGDVWDNRGKKKTPTSPDFRCKDKNCLDAKGRQTAFWLEKKGAQAQREAPAPPNFEEMPPALEQEDDLPF